MGRRRKSNRHLPQRVYIHRKKYRFVPKSGPKVTLGPVDDYGGMLRQYAEIMSAGDEPRFDTLADVMDYYLQEVSPTKCAETERKEQTKMANLRRVFGHFPPGHLTQADAYQYMKARARRHPTAAVREIELLSHVCTQAPKWVREWPPNPLFRMEKLKLPTRDRCPTNAEYLAAWELAPPMVRAAMDLAMLTGLRRGDILGLTRANMTDDGLLVKPSKTRHSSGVELLFEYTPALRDVLRRALAERPQVRQAIICVTRGENVGLAYTSSGFDKAWQRLMKRYVAGGGEAFQFRDLRRKSASDEVDAATASARLGHASQAITDRVYRVKPKKVRPLK
jgi:integrase